MASPVDDPHAGQPVLHAGADPAEAAGAVILIHGRGAGAEDMMGLAREIGRADLSYLAPQAAGRVWYPQSFLAPVEANQPWLDSALGVIARLLDLLAEAGMPLERVLLGGFSQGACLAAEFAARNARRHGGVFVLSGGLIGETIDPSCYRGDFAGTPVFIGCSDIDMHIPLERVRESAAVMRELGAAVDERIYPGMGHTVNADEIAAVRAVLAAVAAAGEEDRP